MDSMRRWIFRTAATWVVLIMISGPGFAQADAWTTMASMPAAHHGGIAGSQPKLVAGYASRPLVFEPNQGQTDPQVRFLSRGPAYTLFLTPTELVLTARGPAVASDMLRVHMLGASAAARIVGSTPLPGRINYHIGNDRSRWRSDVPTYAKVIYEGLYPGIDLVFHGGRRDLEWDFVVAPGADPTAILLGLEGARTALLDAEGHLLLGTARGEVRFLSPSVYQEIDGVRKPVAGRFRVLSGFPAEPEGAAPFLIGFDIAAYDASRPLVIDPVLVYSTYLGGADFDHGRGIAVDAAGNAYLTGLTRSWNFPTTPAPPWFAGGGDAFVTKLSPAGMLVYSTFLGGSSGGDCTGVGIALDASGNAYVTGNAVSSDFPVLGALQETFAGGSGDAFVAKLGPTGALLYSTFLGGTAQDIGLGIAVDPVGNIYVAGQTLSTDFPVHNAVQSTFGGSTDSFVAKLDPTGSTLLYSTYLAGSGEDNAGGIAVDAAGNAYVAGRTASSDFPTHNALQSTYGGGDDAFVTKLDAAGARVYSTYLGGTLRDVIETGPVVDAAGNVYVTGETRSPNFPLVNAAQPSYGGGYYVDVFVAKLNPSGSALLYSTYLGGSDEDRGFAIAVDGAGNAYAAGQTRSGNFPTVNAIQTTQAGDADAFVTKLSPSGTILYSTYLGGSGYDAAFGLAVDAAENVYVSGVTSSTDYPTMSPFQPNLAGSYDAFVTKIGASVVANAGPDQTVDEEVLVSLDGTATTGPGLTYAWSQLAGPATALSDPSSPTPTFTAPALTGGFGSQTLTFKLTASSSGESSTDTVDIQVRNVNHAPVALVGADQTVNEGSFVTLDGSASYDPDGDGITYVWVQTYGDPVELGGANTPSPTFTAPLLQGGVAGEIGLRFELTVSDGTLSHTDEVLVRVEQVNHGPVASAGTPQTVHSGGLVTLNGAGSLDPDGDPLGFAWTQVGGPGVTLTGATTAAPSFVAPPISGSAPLTFQLTVSDTKVQDTATVVVTVNNAAPRCDLARAVPAPLWPPNHRMVPITIAGLTDPNDDTVILTLTGVTQDEPVNGLGDGDTSPDAVIDGGRVLLRAERSGTGNGRVYEIAFTADDGVGGTCAGAVRVGVPKNMKPGELVMDDGQAYNSTLP